MERQFISSSKRGIFSFLWYTMGGKKPLQLFCQIQNQNQITLYFCHMPNIQKKTSWKAPVNRDRPYVFSESMKIYPRMMISKVGWERMELAGDLKALMRSVGDSNWQGLSSHPYAKSVHLVLEALVHSLWDVCPGIGHCNRELEK